jgi:precorrin-3B C17-methyltransferase
MTGSLAIVGLGPGSAGFLTADASAALEAASDVVGYQPYLDRVPPHAGQRRHGSGNRVELNRARLALTLAGEGRQVAVVSGGDPGIFAMAAAIFEAVETGDPSWRTLDIRVVPGISSLQAAAARLGAPLGHDFCAISLSDNLKSWDVIVRRLRAATDGDFVIALFNPASSARPERIHEAFSLLREWRFDAAASIPVAFARAIGRPDERIVLTTLEQADPSIADMSTLVFIGSSDSRFINRPGGDPWLLTPRQSGASQGHHATPLRHPPTTPRHPPTTPRQPRARPGDHSQPRVVSTDPRVRPGDDDDVPRQGATSPGHPRARPGDNSPRVASTDPRARPGDDDGVFGNPPTTPRHPLARPGADPDPANPRYGRRPPRFDGPPAPP